MYLKKKGKKVNRGRFFKRSEMKMQTKVSTSK